MKTDGISSFCMFGRMLKGLFIGCMLISGLFRVSAQYFVDTRPHFLLNDPQTIRTGAVFQLNVLFEYNRCRYYPEFDDSVAALAVFLKNHPRVKVEITGHTDTRTSPEYSVKYSYCRALEIKRKLVEKGVNPEQVYASGCDDDYLLVPDSMVYAAKSQEEQERLHALNRRIEVQILSVK